MSSTRSIGRTRVQVQWVVLAAALTVLAGLVVAWALADAAERVDVVTIGRPVHAGELLEIDDLRIGQVAVDQGITGLVPAAAAAGLVGRVATIDLEPGTLLTAGMWAEDSVLGAGERTVAALLETGRTPADLTRGDTALAVSITSARAAGPDPSSGSGEPGDHGDSGESGDGVVGVRVLDVVPAETGGALLTLAVPVGDAPFVARLAATDALVLVGVPASATDGTDTATDTATGTVTP